MDKKTLDAIIDDTGLKVTKIIELLGINRSMWYRKRQDIGEFSVTEINKLAEILHKTPTEIFEAIQRQIETSN